MLPLGDVIAIAYKTAARIEIMLPDYEFEYFDMFDYEIVLKSQPANETPWSHRVRECRNDDYFVGFIDSCNVEAKLTISCKCWRMRE